MRHIGFYIAVFCSCLLINSCSSKMEVQPDDADAFVGTYSISLVEHVVWGNDSGTLNDNDILTIEKVSANKVKLMCKFIYETADVVGNMIYIPGDTFSDNAGYYTRSYSNGMLNGNVITVTRYHTGQLASYGVLYPYRSTAQITAVKQSNR